MLAYAHQRTDCWFANIGWGEAFDAQGMGAWDVGWDAYPVPEIAALQRQAQRYSEAWGAFEEAVRKPIFLLNICETIARVADSLGMRVVWPGSEDSNDDDSGQGKTLADILGATLTA
jgi:hypothetical protein